MVIGSYIADFVCRSRKLVIELDGDTHAGNEAHDAQRTMWLEAKGYRVIRFTNQEVAGNLEGVLVAIRIACGSPSPNQCRGDRAPHGRGSSGGRSDPTLPNGERA